VSWQTYHAKRGERTDKIAQKFGISLSQLRNVNDIGSSKKMTGSQPLLVPNSSGNTDITPVDTSSAQDVYENPVSNTKQNAKNSVRNAGKNKQVKSNRSSSKSSAKKSSSSAKKSSGAKKSSSSKSTVKHKAGRST
jgi:membrane-bound lytic murein transglycosylase D